MLTQKQKRFADEYLISFNATKSAELAGYKNKNKSSLYAKAYSLKNHPDIKAYIDENLKSKSSELLASRNEILERLTKTVRDQSTEQTVIYYDEIKDNKTIRTHKIEELRVKEKDCLKACEILAKVYNMMTDKEEKPATTIIFKDVRPTNGE